MANPIIISEPEKTINGFVSKWNAIALPVQYIVSNDKYPTGATVTNYRTEIDIWVNGSLIASISQLPDSDNETRIDIRKYLQTVLKFIPSNGNIISSSVENDINAWCTFYIEGSEKYTDSGGVDQENTLDNSGNEFYGTLSSLQLGDNNGGNMYDYVLDSTKTDFAQWLTVLNSGDIVDTLSSFIISTIVSDVEFDLVVKQFDINGIELQEDISSIADLGIGLYRIPLNFLTINIDVNRISILAQKSSTDISETYIISANLDCLDIAEAPTEFTFTTSTLTTLDAICVSTETSFQWEIATDIAFSSIVQTITNSSASVQFTGLDEATEYFGRVKALGITSSPYSNIASGETLIDFGLAINLDGVGDFGDIGSQLDGVLVSNSLSMSVWVNFNGWQSIDEINGDVIFESFVSGGNRVKFLINYDPLRPTENRIEVIFGNGSGVGDNRNTYAYLVVDSNWHNILFTRYLDGSTLFNTFYVDGLESNANSYPNDVTPTTFSLNSNFGGRTSAFNIEATLDNFYLINSYYDASHALAIYNNGNGSIILRDDPNKVIAYDFNTVGAVASGNNSTPTPLTTVSDQSGNGYDMTLTNLALTGSTSNYVESVVQPTVFDTVIVAEMGQSNMEGYPGVPTVDDTVDPIIGREWNGTTLIPLVTDRGDSIDGSHATFFANQLNLVSGKKSVMVEAAKNGSGMVAGSSGGGDWSVSGTLRNTAITKINGAISAIGSEYPLVALWCQGEKDSRNINDLVYTKATAKAELQAIVDWWFTTYPLSSGFFISQTGYHVVYADPGFEDVQDLQQEIVDENAKVFMAFTGAKDFRAAGKLADDVHYDYTGLEEMGIAFANSVNSQI